jgi:hypothetical protein
MPVTLKKVEPFRMMIVCEPAVQVGLVVGHQAVDAQLVAEVRHLRVDPAGVALAAAEHGADDLVAHLHGQPRRVGDHVLTQGHDLAGALVSQDDRGEPEGIPLVLVHVGPADARALDPDQHLVVRDGADGELHDLDLLRTLQDRRATDLRKTHVRTASFPPRPESRLTPCEWEARGLRDDRRPPTDARHRLLSGVRRVRDRGKS